MTIANGFQFRGWTRKYGFRSYVIRNVSELDFSIHLLHIRYDGVMPGRRITWEQWAEYPKMLGRGGMPYVWLQNPVLKTVDPKLYCR